MASDPRKIAVPHPMVARYLSLLHAGKSVTPFYAPDAVVDAMGERVEGRGELEDALNHRLLAGVQVLAAHPLPGRPGCVAFATRVKGRFGEQSIHHEWRLREGQITHHRILLAREMMAA